MECIAHRRCGSWVERFRLYWLRSRNVTKTTRSDADGSRDSYVHLLAGRRGGNFKYDADLRQHDGERRHAPSVSGPRRDNVPGRDSVVFRFADRGQGHAATRDWTDE